MNITAYLKKIYTIINFEEKSYINNMLSLFFVLGWWSLEKKGHRSGDEKEMKVGLNNIFYSTT